MPRAWTALKPRPAAAAAAVAQTAAFNISVTCRNISVADNNFLVKEPACEKAAEISLSNSTPAVHGSLPIKVRVELMGFLN